MSTKFQPYVSMVAINTTVNISGCKGVKLGETKCKCDYENCTEKPIKVVCAVLSLKKKKTYVTCLSHLKHFEGKAKESLSGKLK